MAPVIKADFQGVVGNQEFGLPKGVASVSIRVHEHKLFGLAVVS